MKTLKDYKKFILNIDKKEKVATIQKFIVSGKPDKKCLGFTDSHEIFQILDDIDYDIKNKVYVMYSNFDSNEEENIRMMLSYASVRFYDTMKKVANTYVIEGLNIR